MLFCRITVIAAALTFVTASLDGALVVRGACPYRNGVHCEGNWHCCPQSFTCMRNKPECLLERFGLAVPKLPRLPLSSHMGAGNINCPDGSQCVDTNTCCLLQSGAYGCCPFKNAICCSDKAHCCPSGNTCDLAHGRCVKKSPNGEASTIPIGEKQPPLVASTELTGVKNVICPDATSQCPDGSTCCMLTSGQWGCCPRVQAVCCADKIHCCPHNTHCNVTSGQCNSPTGGLVEAMSKKTASTPVKNPEPTVEEVDKNLCPGNKTYCTDDSTCCPLPSGQYGCCGIKSAFCCADKLHCCPKGYTCDIKHNRCTKTQIRALEITRFWHKMAENKKTAVEVGSVVCPDKQSQCPDNTTCCKLTSGQWGCCPFPKAICCSDKVHCCPENTKCDTAHGRCTQGTLSCEWSRKFPALPREPLLVSENTICPGHTAQCKGTATCCSLGGKRWGCCPLPKAVCCADKVHCCPAKTTCDTKKMVCNKGPFSFAWFSKRDSVPLE